MFGAYRNHILSSVIGTTIVAIIAVPTDGCSGKKYTTEGKYIYTSVLRLLFQKGLIFD